MDYGTDPLVSGIYTAEHKRAAESLLPNKLSMMDALKKRKEWSVQSLSDLKDKGVTPAMMVAAGANWAALQKKHGAQALIDFGFRWSTMKSAGFTGSDLKCLRYDQISALGLNAHRMMECKVHASDISALKLRPESLVELGWNQKCLQAIGINMMNMVDFGFPLSTWSDRFGITNFSDLGFTNYTDCARAGWRVSDIEHALRRERQQQPTEKSMTNPVQRKSGRIQFI